MNDPKQSIFELTGACKDLELSGMASLPITIIKNFYLLGTLFGILSY